MKYDFEKLFVDAKKIASINKAFFKRIKKSQFRLLDDTIQEIHNDVFEEINCLDCANCCRTLGPRITHKDIERMSQALKIKPSKVIELYLHIDEDNDYVFKSMPCPFLGTDNYCAIYPARPTACREYPHTNRSRFYQLSQLTIKNSETCPAVFEILNRLRKEIK